MSTIEIPRTLAVQLARIDRRIRPYLKSKVQEPEDQIESLSFAALKAQAKDLGITGNLKREALINEIRNLIK